MLKYSVSALALVVFSTACGKKEEEITTIDQTTLQGTWTSTCLVSGDKFEKKSSQFEDFTVVMTSTRYSDSACTIEIDRLEGLATFLSESVDTTKSDMTPNSMEYTFETLTWTFVSDPSDAVDYAVACGSTEERGVVDVLDKTCTISATLSKQFPVKAFGLLEIRDGALFMTDFDTNSATADLRPTQYPSRTGLTLVPAAAE